jgi:hypothetical protein
MQLLVNLLAGALLLALVLVGRSTGLHDSGTANAMPSPAETCQADFVSAMLVCWDSVWNLSVVAPSITPR